MKQAFLTRKFFNFIKWKGLAALCLFILPLIMMGQNPEKKTKSIPIQIAIGNHNVGFPYENIFYGGNPSLALGTEFRLNKKIKHRFYAAPNLTFTNNEIIGHSISLYSDLGYRYTHKSGVFSDFALSLGFMSQAYPRKVYEFNETSRTYEESSSSRIGASQVGFGMGFGYDFSLKKNLPIAIFIRNDFFIQSPYFALEMFPIMPQSITKIGIKFNLRKNDK